MDDMNHTPTGGSNEEAARPPKPTEDGGSPSIGATREPATTPVGEPRVPRVPREPRAEGEARPPRPPREPREPREPRAEGEARPPRPPREPREPRAEGEGPAGEGTGEGGAPKRRRRGKRGGRRHTKPRNPDGTLVDGGAEGPNTEGSTPRTATAGDGPAASGDGSKQPGERAPRQPQNRNRSGGSTPRPRATDSEGAPRGGRSTAPKSDDADGGASPKADNANGVTQDGGEPRAPGAPRRRRRGGKRTGGGGDGTGAAKTSDTASDKDTADTAPAAEGGEKRQLTAAELAAGGATRLAARKLREEQRKSRGRGRRPRRLTDADAKRLKGKPKTMLIHDHDERTQIGILEDGQLIEHFVSRRGQRGTMVGNIYLGRVQNVLAGMEAAFVDFGRGRNGIIYANEISFTEDDLDGEIPRIEKALKSGQRMLVQVTKDPIGTKGSRLTTQVTVAGRYLVLAPDQSASGVSRRLSDRERQRLRKILGDLNPPAEHGIIVRTAADGATAEAIAADLRSLLKRWDEISRAMKGAKAPAPLYEEPELIMRVVRDIFADDFEAVVCDSRRVFDDIRGYLQEAAPDLVDKVSLHEGALPLFESYRATEQLHKSLERKVWLPSGGSLIFEKTEAMHVVDVNTGKFTGKGNLEDTVFQNNLEAAEEIARQLRLRDIGGIIIIDFIDMIDPKNQKEVLKTLKQALVQDKTKSQVFEVSNLGLVEMTRKRVSEGLIEAFSEPCPNCDARGIIVQHRID